MFELNWKIEEREKISATVLPKFNKNEEREREKGGERKKRNFGNIVTEIPLPKMLSVQLKKSNCGNAIAEIGKKKIVLAIVAMPLPKMEKKIMKTMNE